MSHRAHRRLFTVCAAAATLVVTSQGLAQVKGVELKEGAAMYDFFTDDLNAAALGAPGALIDIRIKAARTQLIRPRTHFLPELVKSVEHI